MGQGSWDDPRARATRGLRRPSLDARIWDHPIHPLKRDSLLRPCLGQGASRGEEAVSADSGRVGDSAIILFIKSRSSSNSSPSLGSFVFLNLLRQSC